MTEFDLYLPLLAIVVCVGFLFKKSSVPLSLLLLISGMLLSLFPFFPRMNFPPNLVLDVFLPLLVYQMTSEMSLKDIKSNLRPIFLLSVGHIIFITILVAVIIHSIVPELGWPLSFILGAVVSPPDDVAIVPIIEKVFLPKRLITILKSEALFNDAMALILFRFSLIALITHQFSILKVGVDFSIIIVLEILYGVALGIVIGRWRLKISDTRLQMMLSLLSPFIAYLPAVRLGGCGVLATAVLGLTISNRYLHRYPPEVRLGARAIWETLSFTLQSILFLLIGLNLKFILNGISSIPIKDLSFYSSSVIAAVILGRFIWVYPATYLSRFLFPSIRRNDPYPPWQYPFIISWAGLRGSITLAAVLAIPSLSITIKGAHARDLIIFLAFTVILATLLIQGLTLPFVIRTLGMCRLKDQEALHDKVLELNTRVKLTHAVLEWLDDYKLSIEADSGVQPEIAFYIHRYTMLLEQYHAQMNDIENNKDKVAPRFHRKKYKVGVEIIKIERKLLSKLWHQDEISHALRNKLLNELDHRFKQITSQ